MQKPFVFFYILFISAYGQIFSRLGEPIIMEWSVVVNSFIGIIAILNPIGNVPIFLEHVENETPKVQRMVAILLVFFLFGTRLLTMFGITIPAFRLAGSIVILRVGLRMLQGKSKFENSGMETAASSGTTFDQARNSLSHILVPVAMPLFIGPGSITTVILYAEKSTTLATTMSMIFVLFLSACVVGACLVGARFIFSKIGRNGTQIVIRFMGMILCAIAMQFMIDGVAQLLPGVLNDTFVHVQNN